MKDFRGRIAVVTGGGTGMGRELVRKLAALGCRVATCDVSTENMAETRALVLAALPNAELLTVRADVGVEADMDAFRDAVVEGFDTRHVNLLFNNAGIGGGGSFVAGPRDLWERTFNVCWYGVYYCSRAFMPLLVASTEGYVVNTSSVNGFWASIGPGIPHTAYSAAKFAVKGFTEALITDLRVNAPHVKAAFVMPGHIGTSIAINSGKVLGTHGPMEMSAAEIDVVRRQWVAMGLPVGNEPDDHIRNALLKRQNDFRDNAPTTAAQAADVILDGVVNDRWRILVGDDAHVLDAVVREAPDVAYEPEFLGRVQERGAFGGILSGRED
jgi:NAD(P)-dependent dehydrogenase (short-subunit alcohol dehydrogenase family)